MSKGKNKKKVLDLYAAVIKREQSKIKPNMTKKAKKKPILNISSDEDSSDEDEDMEVNAIEQPLINNKAAMKSALKKTLAKSGNKKLSKNNNVTFESKKRTHDKTGESDEEEAFQARIKSLGQVKKTKIAEEQTDN